jgi:hypothetical protein
MYRLIDERRSYLGAAIAKMIYTELVCDEEM